MASLFKTVYDSISQNISSAEGSITSAINSLSGDATNTASLLNVQFLVSQYQTMVGTASSVMKSLSDMAQGIVQKIT